MQYELCLGGLRATTDTYGGELISLRDGNGTEYIWNGDPAFWPGRNPILFPIVGNLKNGRVAFDGKWYDMSRHGFARDSQFQLVEQGADFIVFQLTESESTLQHYPFRFSLRVRHQLLKNGFSTAFTVENVGKGPLPFCIGAHTAFRCPLEQGEAFEEYELVFDQPETASTLLLTESGLISRRAEPMLSHARRLPLTYALFNRLDTIIFQGLHSGGVALRHSKSGRGVHLDFNQFPMVAFWTKVNAPFLCLEPWHGCAALEEEDGQFPRKPHVITLSPGQRKHLQYTASLCQPS